MKRCKPIAAVTKAAEILSFIANAPGFPKAEEIAKGVGLPRGTVVSHLATLEAAGLVERRGFEYDLGYKLAEMWAEKRRRLAKEAQALETRLQAIELQR